MIISFFSERVILERASGQSRGNGKQRLILYLIFRKYL